MKTRRMASIMAAAVILLPPETWAAQFSVLGGVNKPLTPSSVSAGFSTLKPAIGYQGGLLVEFPLSSRFGLELGALYQSLRTTVTVSGTDSTSTSKNLQAPGLFRLWLGRVISLGVGGYYGLSLESGNDTDGGLLGNLQFSLPLGGSSAFVVDGRYLYSLEDPGNLDRYTEVQAMIGITFGARKK